MAEDDFKRFLNSRCRHGYSHRKNCPRCQGAMAAARTRNRDREPEGRSVYDDRKPRAR
jgi:hypothetical protein